MIPGHLRHMVDTARLRLRILSQEEKMRQLALQKQDAIARGLRFKTEIIKNEMDLLAFKIRVAKKFMAEAT